MTLSIGDTKFLEKNREFAEDIKRVSEESTKYGIEIGKRYYLEKKYVNK